MIKQYLEQILGLDKLREEAVAVKKELEEATIAATKAKEEAEISRLSPKERATRDGEPYIAVIETHVNKENIRNGFFELDWNDEFILQLKQAGYGYDGDPDEEIVDRWFRTLCTDVATESGIDMAERGSGFINIRKMMDNKSEIS